MVMSDRRDGEEHPLANYPKPPPRGEDLPYDDGEPMESGRHVEQMSLLIETLRWAWRDRPDVYVSGNEFLYYSEIQSKKNDFRGPDVFVVLDALQRQRRSWVVWEEDGRTPDVVIELLSPTTEHIDRGEKMRIYRLLRVPAYYLYDPWTHVLEGYALEGDHYVRMEPDAQGRLPCAPLGLSLGIIECEYRGTRIPWLRWLDTEGQRVLFRGEFADAETRRADEEKKRADEEKKRADEEKKRADEEKKRADEEKKRADALAARIAELERKP
jgi:Uma2 family endonuclease